MAFLGQILFVRPTPNQNRGADCAPEVPIDRTRLLWKTPAELEALVQPLHARRHDRLFGDDDWLHNYMLSFWEFNNRIRAQILTVEYDVGHHVNVQCQMHILSVPLRRSKSPALDNDLDTIPHLSMLLKYARLILISRR